MLLSTSFSGLVEDDVRGLEEKLILKPTLNSFCECTICQDVCPIEVNFAYTIEG